MKTLSTLSPQALREQLKGNGLALHTGPFSVRLCSPLESVAQGLEQLYDQFQLADPGAFFDFHVAVTPPATWRRWYRPKVYFSVDGERPFKPLPKGQALAVLEWGLNWCIANYAHQFLMIHAAVVEKNGIGIVLPGTSGSGKSTLCAALVARGWRLLSDEMALIDLNTGELAPSPRPISLKNDSIDIIRDFWPSAVVGPPSHGTDKGTVAHIKPPAASVAQQAERVHPAFIIFPRYEATAPTRLTPLPRASSMIRIIESSFNYHGLGARAFCTLADAVERSENFSFVYSQLDEAIDTFNRLCQP